MAEVLGRDNFDLMPTIDGIDIVPSGGSVLQVLTKDSGADYDYSWQTVGPFADLTGSPGVVPDAQISSSSVTQHQGDIDHDQLLNFVANEHATPKNSIQIDSGQLQLVGDAASPGNTKLYGTNGSGVKGWYDQPTGQGGSIQLNWEFKSATGASDPGSGNFRLNNSNPALATAIYVNEEDKDGVDATTLLNALTADDRIYIQEFEDASRWILADVVSVTDNGSWFTIAITIDDSGTIFTDGKESGWVLMYNTVGIDLSGKADLTGSPGVVPDAQISSSSVTQHEGDIDHDQLLNFVANEHATPKNSIEIDTAQLQLVGDSASPGNNKLYGTNGSGTKGWYDRVINLDDISDVDLTGSPAPQSGDLLQFDGSSWKHVPATSITTSSKRHLLRTNGTTTQAFDTTSITLLFGTNVRTDSPEFSYAAGVVTINTSGWYEIEYEVTTEHTTATGTFSTANATAQASIYINSVEDVDTRGYGWHHGAAGASTTFTGRVKVNLSATDTVEIQIVRSGGTNLGLQTVAQACRLSIQSIDAP